MIIAKLFFIFAAALVFLAATTVGVLGAVGAIQFSSNSSALTLVASCVSIIVTVLNAKHLFEDPEAEKTLKQDHLNAIINLKKEQADEVLRLKAEHADALAIMKREYAAKEAGMIKSIRELEARIPRHGAAS